MLRRDQRYPLWRVFWIAIAFPILLLQAVAYGQSTISGRVADAETGEPLAGANIFLAGTTFGDAADTSGQFAISGVPAGPYELIASRVGYETRKIRLTAPAGQPFLIRLQSKPVQIEEVVVTGAEPAEWRENLQVFERVFFGVKPISQECRILNPELLDFRYDRQSGVFESSSRGLLRILNNYLGYELTFVLESFRAQLYDDRIYSVEFGHFLRGSLELKGSGFFTPRGSNKQSQLDAWEENRRSAFEGSLRHFLMALSSDRLQQEGFKIYLVNNIGERGPPEADRNTILSRDSSRSAWILSFPTYLKVDYENEPDQVRYEIELEMLKGRRWVTESENRRVEQNTSTQQSWLSIRDGNAVTFTSRGIVTSPHAKLTMAGYWGWYSPTEWLPEDYNPGGEKE